MAPERFQGAPASVASDIYGMGCLLWAMLTGSAPYAGTELELPMRHLQAPIPQLDGGTPADLAVNHILRRTLAKDPADRYPSAADLRADLRSVPVSAPATRLRPATPSAPASTQARGPVRTPFLEQAPPPSLPVAPQAVPATAASGRSGRGGGTVLLAAGLVAVLVVALGGWLLTRDPDNGSDRPASRSTANTPVAEPTSTSSPTKRPVADAPAAASGSTVVAGDLSGQRGVVLVSPAEGGGLTARVRSVAPATFGQVVSTSRLEGWSDGQGIVAGDFDGDGSGDLARLRQRSGGVAIEVARGTGAGFAEPDEWVFERGWDRRPT